MSHCLEKGGRNRNRSWKPFESGCRVATQMNKTIQLDRLGS